METEIPLLVKIVFWALVVVAYLSVGFFVAWIQNRMPEDWIIHLDSSDPASITMTVLFWPAFVVCLAVCAVFVVCVGGPFAVVYLLVERLTRGWR